MLQRMRELSVQASNGTNGPDSKANIQTELEQLSTQIVSTVKNTSFNGIQLFSGTGLTGTPSAQSITIQAGANASDAVTIDPTDLSDDASDLAAGVDFAASESPHSLIDVTTGTPALTMFDD